MTAFRCTRSTYGGIIAGVLLQFGAAGLWAAEPTPVLAPGSPLAFKQEYQSQFDKRDWTAAIVTAQKLVDAARLKQKADPLGLVEALVLLGNAEAGSKNAVSAELHFGEALTLAEGYVGPTSSRLIEPLTGLGYALAAQGKHETAIPLMERGLVIWRRNYGLFDSKQQSLLRNLAESEGALRRITEGEKHMLYLLSIGERNFGRNDPRLVPLLCIVGNWYVQNALVQAGRDKYRIALDIVDSRLGKNNLAAVEPLRGLAFSYVSELLLANFGPRIDERERERQNGNGGAGLGVTSDSRPINPRYLNPEGERVLVRALKILDGNADRSPQVLVDTLIQLGDILQLRNVFDQALPYYRRAAVTITAELKAKEGDATQLSFPVRIYYPVPLLATRNLNRPPEEVVERYVQTAFTVTAQGGVKDIRVTDKDATPRQIAEATDAVRAARYRPRFVNGEPVDTVDFINREVFKQRKEAE
jgi:tetratricopeptide (TPR) repeat protein